MRCSATRYCAIHVLTGFNVQDPLDEGRLLLTAELMREKYIVNAAEDNTVNGLKT